MKNIKLHLQCAALATALLALPAQASDPYEKQDESWINVSGTVTATQEDAFTLSYDDGVIIVEMDDWDEFDEASYILVGDKVSVYGRIDDSFYEVRTIEADRVFVSSINTYYYADAADEEGDVRYQYTYLNYPLIAPTGTWITVSGTIKEQDGKELTLDTGVSEVKVDTSGMENNPLDNKGKQKISVGDVISVYGELNDGLFTERHLDATNITFFRKNNLKNAS